tara:strand:- start:583 stop:966 length:384 start_codon:yes stop_codon:yes gene_type:complete
MKLGQGEITMVHHQKNNTVQTVAMVGVLLCVVFGVIAIMDTIRDVERMVTFIERVDARDDNLDARLLEAERRNVEDADYNEMFEENRKLLADIKIQLSDQQKQIQFLMETVIQNGKDSARDGPVIQE